MYYNLVKLEWQNGSRAIAVYMQEVQRSVKHADMYDMYGQFYSMNCNSPYLLCQPMSCPHPADTYMLVIRRHHDKNKQFRGLWIADLGNEEFDESVEFM